MIPSGGEEVRFLYSWNNRLEAIEEAIFTLGESEGGKEGGRSGWKKDFEEKECGNRMEASR